MPKAMNADVLDEPALEGEAEPAAAPPRGRRFYIPAMDGLKAVAVAMIFVPRAFWWDLGPKAAHLPDTIWRATIPSGGYGITLFYVVSAFLITATLTQERRVTGGIDLWAFYVRRALRLLPLYWLAIGLAVLLVPYLEPARPVKASWLVPLLTFTFNFGLYPKAPVIVGPFAAACVLAQFYLVWPLVVRFTDRRVLMQIAIYMILFANTWRPLSELAGATRDLIWRSTLTQLDCLGWGVLVALNYRYLNLARMPWKSGLIALLLLLTPVIEALRPFKSDVHFGTESVLSYGLVVAICAAVVLLAAKARNGWVTHPALVEIGKRSYGLSAFQMFVLTFLWKFEPREHYQATILNAMAIVAILGFASYRYFESPFLRLRTRFQRIPSGAQWPAADVGIGPVDAS